MDNERKEIGEEKTRFNMRNKMRKTEKGTKKDRKYKRCVDHDNVPVETKHGEGRAGARAQRGQHTVSPLGE